MIEIREMDIEDYKSVYNLMLETEGITVRDADSWEATDRYLKRNPGLSFIAVNEEGRIIGCVMCGHDGRRGYLQHLIVIPEFRRKGIGRKLVSECLTGLKKTGIEKTHIDVLVTNKTAVEFWVKTGWILRNDLYRLSFTNSLNSNV